MVGKRTARSGGARTSTARGRTARQRVVVAAAVATVVLAGGGVTVAALQGSGDDAPGRAVANGPTAPGTASPGASNGDAAAERAGQGGRPTESAKPSGSAAASPSTSASAGDKPRGSAGTTPGSAGASPSAPPAPGGGSTAAGGPAGRPAQAPVCHAIGGGKYNCTVWRTASSYDAAGNRVGVLNAGTNYFYCQTKGRRETSGQWTNVWWARTDDDSGNRGVFVSDVYIKGGDNDQPVPGLPLC
ncbi:hypothetical protein [Streptomyces sp. URMC 123]|uniref:hypothetical protein n=1 Tax=Streptomyces sp. URMC 123 TaxID=3423403 RepID=UPI003F1DF733